MSPFFGTPFTYWRFINTFEVGQAVVQPGHIGVQLGLNSVLPIVSSSELTSCIKQRLNSDQHCKT